MTNTWDMSLVALNVCGIILQKGLSFAIYQSQSWFLFSESDSILFKSNMSKTKKIFFLIFTHWKSDYQKTLP